MRKLESKRRHFFSLKNRYGHSRTGRTFAAGPAQYRQTATFHGFRLPFLAQTDTNPLTNTKSMFQHSILLLHSSSRFRRTNRWVLFAKVFSAKIEGMASVGVAKGSNPQAFLSENRIFHQFTKVSSLDIFPLYGTYKWRGLHSTVSALSLKVSLSVFNLSNFLYIAKHLVS